MPSANAENSKGKNALEYLLFRQKCCIIYLHREAL